MGCGASSVKTLPVENLENVTGGNDQMEPLLSSEKAIVLPLDQSITLTYAYMSQKGYYPEALTKPNQDTFVCRTPYAGDKYKAFFGVMDGHGSTGHNCSQFARDKVTEKLEKMLMAMPTTDAFTKSFVEANEEMHKAPFDDSLSGTTAICVLFDNGTITTANAGDSRAIIGQLNNDGKVEAKPLSFDQTPFRKDERERVKKYGARILSMEQLEGNAPITEDWGQDSAEQIDDGGDPPRIWAPDGNYPGSAFTRSLGDAVAETLGVVADPEFFTKKLTKADKYIIIASDGVWEFLTNQAVLDIVDKCADPLEACNAVIDQAYELWLRFDVRTDDITMICIKIDVGENSSLPQNDDQISMTAMSALNAAAKPVRQGMSKEKKKAVIIANSSSAGDEKYNAKDHFVPKTAGEIASIADAVKNNFLFQHLNDSQLKDIFGVMSKVHVKPGDRVIQQGEEGDKFYVVDSGDYEVRVKVDQEGAASREDVVHKYKGNLHPSFGELALMFGKPRAASVVAQTDGTLWVLDRLAFKSLLMHNPTQDLAKALRKLKIFKTMAGSDFTRLTNNLIEQTYPEGSILARQGHPCDVFFVIKEGTVELRQDGQPSVTKLSDYECFNLEALTEDEKLPLDNSAVAIGSVTVYRITRTVFENEFGLANKMIERQQRRRLVVKRWKAAVRKFLTSRAWLPSRTPIQSEKKTLLSVIQQHEFGFLGLYCIRKSNQSPVYFTEKVISKTQAAASGQQAAISNDRKTHNQLKLPSPCIPPVLYSVVDDSTLRLAVKANIVYTVEELVQQLTKLDEDIARYVVATAILGLEVIHSQNYIYRGIAPEMLFLDSEGFVQFMDYRFSKQLDFEGARTYTLCGDPEYMAPELVSGQGYGVSVDWWALGILLYDLLVGHTPFLLPGEEENELLLFKRVCSHTGNLVLPVEVSSRCKDLIDSLLTPNADARLGCRGKFDEKSGGTEVRLHPWFEGVMWSQLAMRSQNNPLRDVAQDKFKVVAGTEDSEPSYEKYVGPEEWFSDF